MSTLETVKRFPGSFIGGAWHRNGDAILPVINPADGRAYAEIVAASAGDVDTAAQAAWGAFPQWSKLAVSTAMLSHRDVDRSAAIVVCIVASCVPRPCTASCAVNDVTGALLSIVRRLSVYSEADRL